VKPFVFFCFTGTEGQCSVFNRGLKNNLSVLCALVRDRNKKGLKKLKNPSRLVRGIAPQEHPKGFNWGLPRSIDANHSEAYLTGAYFTGAKKPFNQFPI
jgi:hypothetical protein